MRKLAILSDIHGNVPALEAVLDDIAGQGVDEVLVGGDLVGRGPEGGAVVRRIRSLGLPTIGGNHEDYLLSFRRGQVPDDWLEADEWSASRWMAAELSDDEAAYIADLPFSLARPGLLVHGSPRSNREGIGPWTGDGELEALLSQVAEPLLVCAHTHRPLVRDAPSGRAVNIGSVGLPFNGDPRAQYAIFTGPRGRHGWDVELRQVPYDRGLTYAAYERCGFAAAGGITAQLLRLELEHAAPILVPFLEWARAHHRPANAEQLAEFFAEFRIGQPLGPFFRQLPRPA